MAWTVERAEDCDQDLELIFDFLVESYLSFGDDIATAFDRAESRVHGIEDALTALALAPFQGTIRTDLLPGLRSVTKDRAIFYFELEGDIQVLRVLAIFFGTQDHQRQMLVRLRG